MRTFRDKTAVMTGGASGIGLALAKACASRGMDIVLADIEVGSLEAAAERLGSQGTEVLAVPTDVSRLEQVEALAARAYDRFGKVHLLFNNAGVATGTSIWETSASDWDWVMGVNYGGVLNGIRAFVPRMLAQGEDAHIVNTASVGGLVSYHPCATYQVSKHTVVALSEHLYHSLSLKRARIGVSVLCPGWVRTRILEAERNRPADGQASALTAEERIVREHFARAVEEGMAPELIAEITLDAVQRGQFYVLPDPRWKGMIQQRMEDLLAERTPSSLGTLANFLDDNGVVARLAVNHWRETVRDWLRRTFKRDTR